MNLPSPIHNSYWVTPHSLMAGEYPGNRNPESTRHKLGHFLDRGLNAFLDLTEAHELQPYEDTLHTLAQAKGVACTYRRMPIRDVDVPQQPAQMRAILDQIGQWRQEGRTVYVHCWGGVGRTGTVIGCHLVQTGMTGEAALEHLATLWTFMSEDKQRRKPHTPETPAQRAYILNWTR